MGKFVLFFASLSILICSSSIAQQILFTEDFESPEVSYSIHPAGREFSDGSGDFFTRTDGSGITGSYSVSGAQGSFFFAAMDLDGDGEAGVQTLVIDSINIADFSDLRLSVLLAEDDDGSNEDWDSSDHLHIRGFVDDGEAIELIWIENDGSAFNSAPLLDTDFDGTGNSTLVTDTFQRFEADIAATGQNLRLEFEFDLNAGEEDIAIDDVRVTGIPNATITGNAGWRLLSTPVAQATIAQIADDTAIQGISGGSNPTSDPNIYLFDHSGSWSVPSDVDSNVENGLGMAVYFFDNSLNGSSPLPLSLDMSGSDPEVVTALPINTTTPLAGSGSFFTLAGNPYSRNYDVSAITTDAGFIQDHIHLWDNASGSYLTVDRSSGYVIAPWQGFWIERAAASTASSISFPTSGVTSSDTSATFFRKQPGWQGDLRFTLHSDIMTDRSAKVVFRPWAERGWDRSDASRLIPMCPDFTVLSFNSPDGAKAVESLPADVSQEFLVELDVLHQQTGNRLRLEWVDTDEITEHWVVLLTDRHTGAITDLKTASHYIFYLSDEKAKNYNESPGSLLNPGGPIATRRKSASARFRLHFIPRTTVSMESSGDEKPEKLSLYPNYPNPFNPLTTIEYRVEESGPVRLSVYDLKGRQIALLVNESKSPGRYAVSWNASQMASGVYYYRLETISGTISRAMTLLK